MMRGSQNVADVLRHFDSTAGQTPGRSGMVTLRLEMFDGDGNHVPCANDSKGGIFTFELPDDAADLQIDRHLPSGQVALDQKRLNGPHRDIELPVPQRRGGDRHLAGTEGNILG